MLFDRHPDPKARPSSEALVRMLLKSDRVLLHWSDEDKVVASEATILGKPLSFGENFMKTCRNFMLFINVSEMLHSIIAVFVAPSSFSVDHDMVCWYGDLTFIQYNELHDLTADFRLKLIVWSLNNKSNQIKSTDAGGLPQCCSRTPSVIT